MGAAGEEEAAAGAAATPPAMPFGPRESGESCDVRRSSAISSTDVTLGAVEATEGGGSAEV